MEPSRSTVPSRAARSPRERPRFGAAAGIAGIGITGLAVFVAPLLVGSVHRPAVLGVSLAAGLGAALTLVGEVSRRGVVRVTRSVFLPLSLLLIPLLQSIPLPAAAAGRIDPAGDALLAESPTAGSPFRPLSLDPPDTRAIIAKAGAALAVFLVAFQLASGRSRRRLLLLRGVAASVVVAMGIGLGHRMLGESKIYGHFQQSFGLLNGPFINRNHLAEFLELGAFVCVACALAGASALNRVGWLAAALMCGACALGTFSRGSVLSLAAGTIAFVVLRQAAVGDAQETGPRPSRTMLWVTVMLILMGGLAIGLGADQIVTRVRDTQVGHEARFSLWKDSLSVLKAHPFGIGRGAFESVFPAYRTLDGGVGVRFSFIENEPLQYLVEMGWLAFVAVLIAAVFTAREWLVARRRDQSEAALVAALVAVLVHNFVDFGLETLGIQLPFAAILGTLLGRTRDVPERSFAPHKAVAAWAVALGAIVIGGAAIAHPSSRDFDRLVESPPAGTTKREMAIRAQAAHPVDYFYVLAQAAAEPIAPIGASKSPRLHALNHALLLCPHCPEVHAAVAGTLWALGKKEQALQEWRTAVETRPIILDSILQAAWVGRARPEEIAVIAGDSSERLMKAASFLISRRQEAGAAALLPLASAAGAPPEQVLLMKAGIDIDSGATDEALKSLAVARKLLPQNPRVFLLLGQAHLREGRVDEALQDLDTGIGMNPQNLSLLRARLNIIMGERKWFLAKGALEALEIGLIEARMPTTEVHLAAARYYSTLREVGKANSEYNLVLAQDPSNGGAWAELGALWESSGRMTQALEAYRQSNVVAPGNAMVVAAIQRLSAQIQTLRSGALLQP